jgi:hypothetical protein
MFETLITHLAYISKPSEVIHLFVFFWVILVQQWKENLILNVDASPPLFCSQGENGDYTYGIVVIS